MHRIIRTLTVTAALAAPAVASAYDFGGPLTPPPGGWQLSCTAADLAANIIDVVDYGYDGWRWIRVEVANDGFTDFEAGPGRVGVLLTLGDSSAWVSGDVQDVPAGGSVVRGGWVRLPGYAAPDGEPQFGQCPAEATVSARLSLDPDLGLNGDPAQANCRTANDVDTVRVPYLQGCPW